MGPHTSLITGITICAFLAGCSQNRLVDSSKRAAHNQLDMAIDGEGFYQVISHENGCEVTAYTRAGHFRRDAEGRLVLAGSKSLIVAPPVGVSLNTAIEDLRIDRGGRVWVEPAREGGRSIQVGQLELARFPHPEGLKPIGVDLYVQTEESGRPIIGFPQQDGLGGLVPTSPPTTDWTGAGTLQR